MGTSKAKAWEGRDGAVLYGSGPTAKSVARALLAQAPSGAAALSIHVIFVGDEFGSNYEGMLSAAGARP